MKVTITKVCIGKPDGVHEIVYTDGREYDLPEGLAREFIEAKKAVETQNIVSLKGRINQKKEKEVRDGKE